MFSVALLQDRSSIFAARSCIHLKNPTESDPRSHDVSGLYVLLCIKNESFDHYSGPGRAVEGHETGTGLRKLGFYRKQYPKRHQGASRLWRTIRVESEHSGTAVVRIFLRSNSGQYSVWLFSRKIWRCEGRCGAVYPALHAMIARWVPPGEKGMFVWSMQGGPFGTVVTFALCGAVISSLGWKAAYYVTSGLILVFWALWVWLIYDTPDKHPGITEKEKLYIKEEIGSTVSKQKNKPPVKAVLTSVPFLALLWAHFANMWGIYFIATNGPKYTLEVLGFNMESGGIITGLPYIARLGAGAAFAAIGDYSRKKNYLTVNALRKSFMFFSHFGPAVCLIAMTYAGCDQTWAVVMLIFALGFNGAACQTSLQNHQDLAPNYAGSLYGVMNTIGSFPGFILPSAIGALTNKRNGVEEWRVMFWISAAIFASATLLFWFFGSAEIQPWNYENPAGAAAAAAALPEEEKQMTNGSKGAQLSGDDEEEENARL
ncbi:sialin-like isoform X2 [Athalia rosae]|uniref:sialin-like isoform X2 n=1 Tax=Athalia rosae TaxID=37344 RepID=UPI002033786B|nr:sialin-like isoform X2 [Athalia rosae]